MEMEMATKELLNTFRYVNPEEILVASPSPFLLAAQSSQDPWNVVP